MLSQVSVRYTCTYKIFLYLFHVSTYIFIFACFFSDFSFYSKKCHRILKFFKITVFSFLLGVLVLIDSFVSSVRTLTAVRSSVLTAGDDEDKNNSRDDHGSEIFETLEILLLFSGSVLPQSMREDIEICVGRGTYMRILMFRFICFLFFFFYYFHNLF